MRAMPDTVFAIAAMILTMIAFCPAGGVTYVNPGQSIQAAIDSASQGDTIEVNTGTYSEQLVIDKPIRLVGVDTGGGKPIVDSGDSGSAITISADGVYLEGFQAYTSSGWGSDAGILVKSNGSTIKDNIASSNGNDGILLVWSTNNTLDGNTANDNQNNGISLEESSNNTLQGNEASYNRYGFRLEMSTGNTVKENTVVGNKFEGFYLDESHRNLVQGNLASSNWGGISLDGSKYNEIAGNEVLDNERGIYLSFQNNSGSLTQTAQTQNGKKEGVYISYSSRQKENSGEGEISRNKIYLNNLSNSKNAYDDGVDQWDNGVVGNNFSDFNDASEGCNSTDGICSTWYRVPGGTSVDRYPQAAPVVVKQSGSRSLGYGGADLQISMPRYKPSSVILLNFSSPENASIGLDLGDNDTVEVREVGKNSSGSLNFTAPSQEGRYQIRMWNSSGLTLVSVPLDVATPRMSASPVSVAACEDITVAFSGAPGLDRDWIGMFPLGAPDTGYSDRQFIGGKGNGTVIFTAPSGSGSYEFRLFDGQELLSKSNSVEVSGGSSGVHVTAEPKNAHPGDVITVRFRGAPTNGAGVINMYEITTPDKFYSDSRSLGTSGCGKVTFVVRSPGTYDFRMFQDNVYRQILGMSNAVTVT